MARPTLPDRAYDRLREHVMARDGWRCKNPLCRKARALEVDHVIERSQGGPDEAANLVTLCNDCHMLKSARILIVIPNGDGTFRFHDSRRVLTCEVCQQAIAAGALVAVPTAAGGVSWRRSRG
jgi:hypothetical protein